MVIEDFRAALLQETHRAVDDATQGVMRTLIDGKSDLTYPPGIELTDGESEAVGALRLSPDARSALEKIVRDAASYPLFHLFTLIDAIGDPRDWTGPWLGAKLSPRLAGDVDTRGAMWHDDFYDSYRTYHDSRER
jgi:hypothetical protein